MNSKIFGGITVCTIGASILSYLYQKKKIVDLEDKLVKQQNLNKSLTDENSELYGCVKVDEEFAKVLSQLMDKYTFEDVEYSWVKLCYYYKYLGPTESI